MSQYKPVKIIMPDGELILNAETSEAIGMYAQAKQITISQAVDEILKHLIQLKKENHESRK